MVKDVRGGIQHAGHGIEVPAKIGRKRLDASFGEGASDFANRLSEVPRSAIGKIVAIHAGDHHVAQTQGSSHTRDVRRLLRIERTGMTALGNGAESASARTQIAQDHERRGAAMEALVKVGTPRGLAYRIQAQAAKLALQIVDGCKMAAALSQPNRQPGAGRRKLD